MLESWIENAASMRIDNRAIETCKRALDAYCVAETIESNECYNRVALTVAKRFDEGAMAYDDADTVMNLIYHLMMIGASEFGDGFELAEPAFSIYLAFDEGEYDHHDGADPVEKYTRPAIKKVLGGV